MDAATITTQLESIITRAVAITMGHDTSTDAGALLDESNRLWTAIAEQPVEMAPVVSARAKRLAAELDGAPREVKEILDAHQERVAAWRGEWLEPPRLIVAFMVLDALERIAAFVAARR